MARQSVPDMPGGIRIDLPEGFSFAGELTIGDAITCRAGVLRIAGSDLRIDLRSAKVWNGVLAPAEPPQLAAIWKAWAFFIDKADLGPIIGQDQTVIGAQDLRALLSGRDRMAALTRLIGRGPGLTPAGDDFVVGFLAGHLAVQSGPLVLNIDNRATNDISYAALLQAERGYFSAPLLAVIDPIRQNQIDLIEPAIMENLAIGETSGTAGAFGVLIALLANHYEQISDQVDDKIMRIFRSKIR